VSESSRLEPRVIDLGSGAEPRGSRRSAIGWRAIAAVSLLIAALLWLLNTADKAPRFVTLAILGFAVIQWATRKASRDPAWLPLLLIFAETLPYLNIIPIDPKTRWFLRYPLLIPLCMPPVWMAIRSGVLWQGRFRWFLVFFSWAAVTIAYSLNPAASAGRLLPDVLLFAAITYAASTTESAADVDRILGLFLIGCAVLQLLTLFAYVALPTSLTYVIDEQHLLRFSGFGTDPNAVGALMMVTVGAGIAHWPVIGRWRRAGLALVMLSSLFFAIVADSRSTVLVTILGIMSYAIWQRGRKAALICAVLAVLAINGYGLIGAGGQAYLNRDVSTLTGRTEAWQFELRELAARPLLGYGYEVEGEIFQDRYFTNWQKAWDYGVNTSIHNAFLSVAVGMGVPALFLWLFIFIKPWYELFRDKDDPWRLKPIFFLIVLPQLLLSFVESGLSEPRSVRGLLIFTVWALAEHYRIWTGQKTQPDGVEASPRLLSHTAFIFASVPIVLVTLTLMPTNALADAAALRSAATHGAGSSVPTLDSTHFRTLPIGAVLPTGEQCAAMIPASSETIPGNEPFNQTIATPSQLRTFAALGYTFERLSSYAQFARISGNYTGSTDMMMRWAACKYGIDEDVVRGQAWQESGWWQWQTGDRRSTPSQCVQGSFSSLWSGPIVLVNRNVVSCPNCCWTSWSAWQTKVFYEWKTWPMIKDSTSFAADYRYAETRACMEGAFAPYFSGRHPFAPHNTYSTDLDNYRRAPSGTNLDAILWGCIGMHYTGDWYDSGAVEYISDVKGNIMHRRWLTPERRVTGP
jgi:O-antigen ligase